MKERTDEEIVKRCDEVKNNDWLGTQISDLIDCMGWDAAKPFLKDEYIAKVEAGEEEWVPAPRDRESMVKKITNYMSFAWGKANNCRGISAGRSIDHFDAWIWLAGDDIELPEYEHYGKEILIKICEHYGIDHAQWDDGIRTNFG